MRAAPRPNLTDLRMQGPADFTWPVTFRWDMWAPWGQTQAYLSIDVPGLKDKHEQTRVLGRVLWDLAIAPAISHDIELELCWAATWRNMSIPIPVVGQFQRGVRRSRPSSRDDAAQLVFLTGHRDPYGKRRFFLPGIPREWVHEGQLLPAGFEALLTHARGLYLGVAAHAPNNRSRFLLAYENAVTPELENPFGVGFRTVTHVRVCQHTDKAPERTSTIWP